MIRVFSKWLPEYYRGIGIGEGLELNMENPRTWWYEQNGTHVRFCAHTGDTFWFVINHSDWYSVNNGRIVAKLTNKYHKSQFIPVTNITAQMRRFEEAMQNERNAFAAYIAKWYFGLASLRRSLGMWIPKDVRRLLVSYFN